MLGAILHGARRWRPVGANRILLPLLSPFTAELACFAMAVTRSEVLASSHRYIGTTSWLSHLILAAAFTGLTLWRGGLALRRPAGSRQRRANRALD